MRGIMLLAAGMALIASGYAAEPKPTLQLTLVDMQGNHKLLGALPDSVVAPRVSPDGMQVAWEQVDPPEGPGASETTDLYVADLAHLDKPTELNGAVIVKRNESPVWSPENMWIVFLATGNGSDALFRERANGSEQPKYLVDGKAPEDAFGNDELTYLTLKGDKDYGIALLDMHTGKAMPLIDQPGSAQHSSAVSPDAHWIAYASNETGRDEVWLEPLPTSGKRYQLTKSGGSHPQWSPDGKTLYFDQGGQLFRMSVTTGTSPAGGAPVALPIKGFQQGAMRRQYDLTPDGKGFVMLFAPGPGG